MNSCIYEGKVRHRRSMPKHHQFDFRTFMLMLDLDELSSVFAKRWFWSTKPMALARFRKEDRLKSHSHLDQLRDRVAAVLTENGISQPLGSIRLLTQLRYLGFEMNPVCFYYCFSAQPDDTNSNLKNSQSQDSKSQSADPQNTAPIIAIIAEVNNTPWGQQHNYVIQADEFPLDKRNTQANVRSSPIDKTFHVSPFLGMNMDYRMAFSIPGEKLGVKIENHVFERPTSANDDALESSLATDSEGKKILDVAMLLERRPISGMNLNWMLIKYPLFSFKTFAGIYWQALRLYLKGIPFFPHPRNTSPEDSSPEENQMKESKPTKSKSALVGQ